MAGKNFKYPYEFSDHALKKYFLLIGERQGFLRLEKKNLVTAISGGGDSVALLWLFKKFYDGEIIAAHVNHKIRGQDSDLDAEFVRELAFSWNIKFYECAVNVLDEKFSGESLETAARRIRYRELERIALENNSSGILLGHNRDDLAETVLFNLFRGSGIRGAVGIPETNSIGDIKIFRPLIDLRRNFLRELLRVRGISWREDNSNLDTAYTRNFIRLELLPLIENKINSRVIDHVADFAKDITDFRAFDEERGHELLRAVMLDSDDENILRLDRKKLRTFKARDINLIIRELGRNLNIKTLSRDRLNELTGLIIKNDRFIFQWCGCFTIEGTGGFITCKKF